MASLRHIVCAAALLACAGCGSDADIVAVGSLRAETDAGAGGAPIDPQLDRRCEPGTYEGSFKGDVWVGSFGAAIAGRIQFALEVVPNREFLAVTGSELVGQTDETLYTVRADIESEGGVGCSEGEFSARLENGVFADSMSFTGTVSGTYDATRRVFEGRWQTFRDTGEQVGEGDWGALFSEEQ